MLDKVLQMRVILPPLEINCLFHMASLFQNLSSTPSHTSIDLCEAPNKWKEAPPPCNQAQGPKSLNSLPSPIGKISLLSKLILKPDMASNHINN